MTVLLLSWSPKRPPSLKRDLKANTQAEAGVQQQLVAALQHVLVTYVAAVAAPFITAARMRVTKRFAFADTVTGDEDASI